jgi:16S rRNA (guanine527-N7)-methyltransferase
VDIVTKYFPYLTTEQIEMFEKLEALYTDWNQKINVISRKDIESLYEKHVLHSLSIAMFTSFKIGTKILDVGTGGGFPGIPLAILFPETDFHLVDSIGKKIKVVNQVSAELGLKNIIAEQARVENLIQQYDFIVSRAVTNLPDFTKWVKNKIKKKSINSIKNGIIYLKGGDFEDELNQIKMKHQVIDLSDWFDEEFFETKKLVYLF